MAKVILSLKAALISTGVVSAAVILKLFLPYFSEFIVSNVPSVYSLFVSYLRPPYLYFLINGIIISIVASSKLQCNSESVSISQTLSPELGPVPDPPPIISGEKYTVGAERQISAEAYSTGSGYDEENTAAVVPTAPIISSEKYRVASESQISAEAYSNGSGYGEENAAAEAVPLRSDSIELLNEKFIDQPSASKRFGQRKPVKSATEGKSLGVSKPRRQDTLESTWRTITEGRSVPLTRHLKKSDTWERVQKDENARPPPLPNKNNKMMMKKSDTFHSDGKRRSLVELSQQGRLKKDPSLSQDELNRRVEAFINKFNEEMRLQRQESLNQYRR